MNERHFDFNADPFSQASDPAIFFGSRQHRMAESFLEYALESQGTFSLLTGEIGCGKSLLVGRLLSKLGDDVMAGLINRPHGRLQSIQRMVVSALGIEHRGDSNSDLYETLVTSLQQEHAKGRRTLLIVDEAQNLSFELLEELRLLSNANSSKNFLQILLVGQPELRARLTRRESLQLAQRVSAQFHLSALQSCETHPYIRYRLQAVGGNPSLFTPDAMDLVHAYAGGVPRLINQLCHYALSQASVAERTRVDADLMMKVPQDFCGGLTLQFPLNAARRSSEPAQIVRSAAPGRLRPLLRPAAAAAAGVAALALGGVGWWQLHRAHSTYATMNPVSTSKSREVAPAASSAPTAPPVGAPLPPAAAPAAVSAPVAVPVAASAPASPSARPTWYVNRAIERLNGGDPAGAEHLMFQATAAGARPDDLADLRSAIDAQKLELRLVSAADQIRVAIAAGELLEPATDSADSRYQEMASISPNDPLTLRARRELHAALLEHAHDAIGKDQTDAARRFLAAAAGLGSSTEFGAAREQLHEELSRSTQRANAAATAPTVLDNAPKDVTAPDVIAAQASSHHE